MDVFALRKVVTGSLQRKVDRRPAVWLPCVHLLIQYVAIDTIHRHQELCDGTALRLLSFAWTATFAEYTEADI